MKLFRKIVNRGVLLCVTVCSGLSIFGLFAMGFELIGCTFVVWRTYLGWWLICMGVFTAFSLVGDVDNGGQMNLIEYLQKQKAWSRRTFGPGQRDEGLIDHIKKELKEIEAAPGDLMEWIDVIILALDAAWRNGFSPEDICKAMQDKQAINFKRRWPKWGEHKPGKAVEHVRGTEE